MPEQPRKNPWWPPFIACAIIGALLGCCLPILSVPAPLPCPSGNCQTGPVVALLNTTLTPYLLINSPYRGLANGSLPIPGGVELTIYPTNGSTTGYFEHIGWIVRDEVPAPGSSSSCSGLFNLTYVDEGTSTTFSLFNGTVLNFTNDSEEPNEVTTNWTSGPVLYSNGFLAETGRITTCDSDAATRHTQSTHIVVGVPFQSMGVWHLLDETLAIPTTYSYTFPADTGTWLIDNLSAPGGPGRRWAFSYSPC